MKCPICGNNVELKNKQFDLDEYGDPIFHQYAICKNCKKQWDLDKQRAKKMAAKDAAEKEAAAKKEAAEKEAAAKKAAAEKEAAAKKAAAKKSAETNSEVKKVKKVKKATDASSENAAPVKKVKKAAPKAVPAEDGSTKKVDKNALSGEDENYLGNVPPKKVRTKRERVVKQGYEDMVAADPSSKKKKKRTAEKPVAVNPAKSEPEAYDDYVPVARFRALRIIFGILSILVAAFYGLNSYAAGLMESSEGFTFLILAGCMALAGLLLIILNFTNNILAFLLPMILYLGSGVYAFLNRANETFLLYGAIIGAAFSVLFIILAISSRGDEEDYDNYDDDEDDDDTWDDDDDY